VIAFLFGIQALFTLIAGFALFIERNDQHLLDHVAQSSGELGAVGIAAIIIGLIGLVVSIGVFSGNNFARALVGILSVLQLIGGIYQLIFFEGALRWHGLWEAIVAGLILYLLYNRDADRFFASR
jgi:hypothetical protein